LPIEAAPSSFPPSNWNLDLIFSRFDPRQRIHHSTRAILEEMADGASARLQRKATLRDFGGASGSLVERYISMNYEILEESFWVYFTLLP
jgi:hypothetical protein